MYKQFCSHERLDVVVIFIKAYKISLDKPTVTKKYHIFFTYLWSLQRKETADNQVTSTDILSLTSHSIIDSENEFKAMSDGNDDMDELDMSDVERMSTDSTPPQHVHEESVTNVSTNSEPMTLNTSQQSPLLPEMTPSMQHRERKSVRRKLSMGSIKPTSKTKIQLPQQQNYSVVWDNVQMESHRKHRVSLYSLSFIYILIHKNVMNS